MRAGAFAEKRVIDLINRRFVPVFFATGSHGQGQDQAAKDFVRGKVPNKWAFFAAFTPDGKYLSSTGIYADKNDVFVWLQELLAKYPQYAAPTADERQALVKGDAATARLLDELGRYDDADKLYAKNGNAIARARLARYRQDWKTQQALLAPLRAGKKHAAPVAVEDGYRLTDQKKWAAARKMLEPAAKAHEATRFSAELHFLAGKACYHLDAMSWANFHFGWILKNRPNDRLVRRAWTAASDTGSPYPNAELQKKSADRRNMCSPQMLASAVQRAMRDYDRHAPEWKERSTGTE